MATPLDGLVSVLWARKSAMPVLVSLSIAVVAYIDQTRQYFPLPSGLLGHDYSYFLSQLLAGFFWSQNNSIMVAPLFTPAFCGGLPLIANPQSIFYSLPQTLLAFVDPIQTSYLTLLVFAGGGAITFHCLLRRVFELSSVAAALGAIGFLFNGFLTYRMAIGHFPYHSFALIPPIALAALSGIPQASGSGRFRTLRLLFCLAVVACCFAYIVYSGGTNFVVPVALSVMTIGLLHHVKFGARPWFWGLLGLGAVLGGGLSLFKLAPAWAFILNFPRFSQKLALFDNLPWAGIWFLRGLFLPETIRTDVWLGSDSFGRHEFEFGVSIVPAALLLLAGVLLFLRRGMPRGVGVVSWPGFRPACALLVILAVPLLLTIGPDSWGRFLKSIPYIQNNKLLTRWWSIYIPIVLIMAAFCFDYIFRNQRARNVALLVCVSIIVLQNRLAERDFYLKQTYNPGRILAAYQAVKSGGAVPAVREIGGRGTDLLVEGRSPFPCYEPIFGYVLEDFPARDLVQGDVFTVSEGRLNFNNPACFIYGADNGCAPGDRFHQAEIGSLLALAQYRPFDVRLPAWQKAATTTTHVSLALTLCLLLAWPGATAVAWVRKKLRGYLGKLRLAAVKMVRRLARAVSC